MVCMRTQHNRRPAQHSAACSLLVRMQANMLYTSTQASQAHETLQCPSQQVNPTCSTQPIAMLVPSRAGRHGGSPDF
jgi:hypothetical protein